MNYHIGRLVLSPLCVWAFVVADGIWWCSFCRLKLHPAKRTPPKTSRTKSSNTQRTENKTTDVVIHQHGRKLLKMDILMSETCWAHKKWNKIASDIKLVFHSSTMSKKVFERWGLFYSGLLRCVYLQQNIMIRRNLDLSTFLTLVNSKYLFFINAETTFRMLFYRF